ncbi:flagellar hook-associated protein FlgK [Opitutaceae bacterium TAV3]|nr:flagellar hook-associated protein FlgK [Opitutaceae bacterium TAV3]
MSGLLASLSHASSALNAHSRAIEVTSNNIANINNEDYSRQRVVYSSRGTVLTAHGVETLGIEARTVQQLRDALLDKQVTRETAKTASITAERAAYARVQTLLGETIDTSSDTRGNGLSAALSDTFNSFQALAASPTDQGEKQTLLANAAILVDRIRTLDADLAQAQTDLDDSINQDIGEVQDLLAKITELNQQIARFEINDPGTALTLRDERQAALEDLAQNISFETRTSTAHPGQIDIYTHDTDGNEVPLITAGSPPPATLTYDPATGTLSTDGGATTLALTGGTIHGSLAARDGAIKTLRDNIDTLARQLITSVNDAYNPDSDPGHDFFTGTGAGDIALAPGLTTATLRTTATGGAGDSDLITALANLINTRFSTADGALIDGTLTAHYTSAVSHFGQAVSSADTRHQSQYSIETLIREQRDSTSGVSLDEETINLVNYQRAYQASARVITILDDLLNTVVNRLGVT